MINKSLHKYPRSAHNLYLFTEHKKELKFVNRWYLSLDLNLSRLEIDRIWDGRELESFRLAWENDISSKLELDIAAINMKSLAFLRLLRLDRYMGDML